jgi:acyl-CoA reductase-like NAD-dependent aldehyde dehydrogenase
MLVSVFLRARPLRQPIRTNLSNLAKRVYIHDDVYETVKDALVAYAKNIKIGDGSDEQTQIGPIQNKMQ